MPKPTDFFEIDTKDIPIKKPINRNAFTLADVQYKLKWIKAMQKFGEVTIDQIGNLCLTIPGKIRTDKSVICLSHTDSVDNGGQFDGPLGVYAAFKTTEDIVKSGKSNAINYKMLICACEESTRFEGKGCLGSKFLRGDDLDFDNLISREGTSLRECIAYFKAELFKAIKKEGLKPLKEVDKVIHQDEIVTALEGHIEQADVLHESGKTIGICTSIVAPYRLKADISDIETAAKFICRLDEVAKNPENLQKYRATVPEFSIKNSYNPMDLRDKKIITLRAKGKHNHSGTTPMDKRQDAVIGTAKFITNLCENPDIQFLETCTPNWGSNQITNCCEIKFAVDNFEKNLPSLSNALKNAQTSANIHFEKVERIEKPDKKSGLYVDIRQQIGMNPELSCDLIFETAKDIVHKTHCPVYMNIATKGKPYETHSDLIQSAAQICKNKQISHQILRSWAGHDLATLTKNPDARTLLLFCASTGGSHNVDETTTLDAIEKLVNVESALAQEELERANQLYFPKNNHLGERE